MGFIYPCPEYISVKTLILRSINKKLPSNVTTFNEIPNESEYYLRNIIMIYLLLVLFISRLNLVNKCLLLKLTFKNWIVFILLLMQY